LPSRLSMPFLVFVAGAELDLGNLARSALISSFHREVSSRSMWKP